MSIKLEEFLKKQKAFGEAIDVFLKSMNSPGSVTPEQLEAGRIMSITGDESEKALDDLSEDDLEKLRISASVWKKQHDL